MNPSTLPTSMPTTSPFLRWVAHPRFVPLVFLLALVLSLPSLTIGFLSDDHFHRAILQEKSVVPESDDLSLFGLFSFSFGSAEHIYESVNVGALPWWSDPNVQMKFFRPLSELSHWIDYALFSDSPVLMHAHSILWYMLLLWVSWLLMQRLFPVAWMAGLAVALHALDGSNGGAVGWIADRNALITTALGLLAVLLHLRGRLDQGREWVPAAIFCFAVALLAGENAFATTAYLFAFAVWLDPHQTFWRRLLTLAPYAMVSLVWLGFYKLAGFGAHHSGMYVDPFTAPLQYFGLLLERMPLLLEAHFSALPVSLDELRMPGYLRALFLLAAAWLLWPVVKAVPAARFFATGLLLSLLPVCAAKPEDRLLIFSSFSAMGLLAVAIIYWRTSAPKGIATSLANMVGAAMLFIHLVLSPITFVANYQLPAMALERITVRPALSLPISEADRERDVVLLNPPVVAAAFFQTGVRLYNDLPLPRNQWILAPGMADLRITALDEHTLLLEPQLGFMNTANDWYIRSPATKLAEGQQFDQGNMIVTVRSLTTDGRPAQVEFRFAEALGSDKLRLFRWQQTGNGLLEEGQWQAWTPPAVGQTATLSVDLSQKLMSASTKNRAPQ